MVASNLVFCWYKCLLCFPGKVGPAPGQYNVKDVEKAVGTVKFYCSERFKSSESLQSDGTSDSKDFAVPSGLPSSSSKRKLFSEKGKSVSKMLLL